jgi:phosphoribosylformylglycinamidine cyclo-ligase
VAQDKNILKIAKGFAHITGGGIIDNLPRIFPDDITAKIQLDAWEMPENLKWVIKQSNLTDSEALKTFNCGIGFITIVSSHHQKKFVDECKKLGEDVFLIGETVLGNELTLNGNLIID